jgi:U5 small nuclear ribonucleoprotein component
MSSLDDYDEFGNYIGADLESDDEDIEPSYDFAAPSAPIGGAAPLEGFDEESGPGEGALMEIDGTKHHVTSVLILLKVVSCRACA